MGYFVENKQIAKVTEPKTTTLADNPNYIIFERNDNGGDIPVELKITIKGGIAAPYELKHTGIVFKEKLAETTHGFIGTGNPKEVNSHTFYIGKINKTENPAGTEVVTYLPEPKEVITENLKNSFMADSFFRNNFNISIPPKAQGNIIRNGDTIRIISKGCGGQYAFTIEDKDKIFDQHTDGDKTIFENDFYTISLRETLNNDSIDQGQGDTEIQLDVYGDTGIFSGKTDFPAVISTGTFRTDVSKKYFGQPLWFDTNTLIDTRRKFSDAFLSVKGWTDTGTVSDYRLVARYKRGVNLETFFYSDVIYAVTGYTRSLENNDLAPYIYNMQENNTVRPLTNQPVLPHANGQKQYFNFLLSDPTHDDTQSAGYEFGILYKLYTPSGKYITDVSLHTQNSHSFGIANTVELEIDYAIRNYPNTGIVKAYLHRNGQIVSQPLQFRILPPCLHSVHDFAFLNSLGGWSSFNFTSTEKTEFKTEANTYHATPTPLSNISSRIEGVQFKEIEEQFIAKTMPVDDITSQWLKEMSTSIAVYEIATKRYVVVDDFSLKYNSDEDLFQYEMKYRYSDSYNAK